MKFTKLYTYGMVIDYIIQLRLSIFVEICGVAGKCRTL